MNYLSIPVPWNIRRILIAFVCIISGIILPAESSFAQVNFQKGLIIIQAGDTLRGLIKNRDWLKSPETISFKEDSSSKAQSYSKNELKGFRVSGELYERRIVTIDETPLHHSRSLNNIPSSRKDTVFLSVLVKGPLSLYFYHDSRDHYFMEDSGGIEELVAHEYQVKSRGRMYVNSVERYKDQLEFYSKNCPEIGTRRVRYGKKSFIHFVKSCNKSKDPGFVQYAYEPENISFGSQIYGGLSNTYFDIKFGNNSVGFAPARNLTIGYSALFTFPRNHRNRLIFADLQFYRFESTNAEPYSNRSDNYVCVNDQCSGFTITEFVDDMSVQANYLKLALGYRRKFTPASFRPFADFGLTVSKRLSYNSYGYHDVKSYSYQGTGLPTDEELVLENSFQGNREVVTPGSFSIGLAGGIGVQAGLFDVTLKGEISHITKGFSIAKSAYVLVRYTLFR